MLQTFERASVAAQAADYLRRNLQQGEWPGRLPGERSLCDLMQVSRPTLRAALALLEREGWIRVSAGRWTRILPPSGKAGRQRGAAVVGLLAAVSPRRLSSFQLFLLGELRRRLQDAGYQLQIHADSRYHQRNATPLLEREVRPSRVDAWVLHGVSIATVLPSLLQDKARPTALLVTHPVDVLALMTSLMNAGLRLPDDLSLISRDDETFLNYVNPSIARYRVDEAVFAQRLAREVIRLATTRTPGQQLRQIWIGSHFQPGDTLGRYSARRTDFRRFRD